MLQKGSYINFGILNEYTYGKIIHTYGGSCRKYSSLGDFIRISSKGYKLKEINFKKVKLLGIVVLVRYKRQYLDSSTFFVSINSCLTLKRRFIPHLNSTIGISTSYIKRQKFKYIFTKII